MTTTLDLEKQRIGTIGGLGRFECGEVDFSSGSATLEVATRLVECFYGHAIAATDSNGNHGLVATTDCSITSSAVTFTRQTDYLDEDATYRYILAGW